MKGWVIEMRNHKTEIKKQKKGSKESLYRTMWLMAHNRLHAVVHDSSVSLPDAWRDYLKDLRSSKTVAKTPA